MKFDTKAVHSGEAQQRILGSVNVPIFQSSTYESKLGEDYFGIKYLRLSNSPNHELLHQKIADLEGSESALVTASGMAAISSALFSFLHSGDHLMAQNVLYGGTHDLIKEEMVELGIEHTLVDGRDPSSWEKSLQKNTKVFYLESLSNPLIQVSDLEAALKFSKKHNLITMVDNTFATPMNFRPCEFGFDLSLHSASKSMNGHSDIIAGAVAGSKAHIKKIRRRMVHFGGSLDPHSCFLLNRGMKTWGLRLRAQTENAHKLAQFLDEHPKVKKVHYPGLKNHPDHKRAKSLFKDFGGMLSFELNTDDAGITKFISSLKYPFYAPSLGGCESLITRPARTSHLRLSKKEKQETGITEALIRFSLGIEDAEDLIQDLGQALDRV
jgi:cystathionine beta-lyase/cystathionine gamma-synthase